MPNLKCIGHNDSTLTKPNLRVIVKGKNHSFRLVDRYRYPGRMNVMSNISTHGLHAIQSRLDVVYPNVEPAHFAPVQRFSEGGPDPLDGISVYQNADHWHYFTFGFSELGEKESDNPDISGWGFELSFRLLRSPDEAEAPQWPITLLQTVARYVFNQSAPFDDGHYISWGGPITSETETSLSALLFMTDDQLGVIETPNGRVVPLAVVPLLNSEYESVADQGPDPLLNVLRNANDCLITDLSRQSPIA